MPHNSNDTSVALTIKEVRTLLKIGNNLFYELVKRGEIKTTKLSARKTVVLRTDFDAYLTRLQSKVA